jgi:predicted chitinase
VIGLLPGLAALALGGGGMLAARRRKLGMRVTLEQLQALMPRLPAPRARELLPHLVRAMEDARITTLLQAAAFLAQLAFESGELRYFEELASGEAYEGRENLGNTQPGDGPRYKGRGPIQLTGRANYRAAGRALGLPLEQSPGLAATPAVGFRVAAWYWTSRGLNELANRGTLEAFREVTRRINGGYRGLADREAYWHRAKAVLGGAA